MIDYGPGKAGYIDPPYGGEYARNAPGSLKFPPTAAQIAAGVASFDTLPASWWNDFLGYYSKQLTELSQDVQDIYSELTNVLTEAGITPNANIHTQLKQAILEITGVSEQYLTPTNLKAKLALDFKYNPMYPKTDSTNTIVGVSDEYNGKIFFTEVYPPTSGSIYVVHIKYLDVSTMSITEIYSFNAFTFSKTCFNYSKPSVSGKCIICPVWNDGVSNLFNTADWFVIVDMVNNTAEKVSLNVTGAWEWVSDPHDEIYAMIATKNVSSNYASICFININTKEITYYSSVIMSSIPDDFYNRIQEDSTGIVTCIYGTDNSLSGFRINVASKEVIVYNVSGGLNDYPSHCRYGNFLVTSNGYVAIGDGPMSSYGLLPGPSRTGVVSGVTSSGKALYSSTSSDTDIAGLYIIDLTGEMVAATRISSVPIYRSSQGFNPRVYEDKYIILGDSIFNMDSQESTAITGLSGGIYLYDFSNPIDGVMALSRNESNSTSIYLLNLATAHAELVSLSSYLSPMRIGVSRDNCGDYFIVGYGRGVSYLQQYSPILLINRYTGNVVVACPASVGNYGIYSVGFGKGGNILSNKKNVLKYTDSDSLITLSGNTLFAMPNNFIAIGGKKLTLNWDGTPFSQVALRDAI
jgi:hypothetical protein